MGDIHGACRALNQCLERSEFDVKRDHLICLGDVCDGWPQTSESIERLLEIKNLTYILGNHDYWMVEWMKRGFTEDIWLSQGGRATIESYPDGFPVKHLKFMENALPYFELGNRLFVHAGIDPRTPVKSQSINTFLWDRSLARMALDSRHKEIETLFSTYDEIYIGHTPVPFSEPIRSGNVWLMDTGAGWSGVLSIMDVDSKQVFTSDPVPSLYPGVKGRSKF
jgi:serine/threonine protein phosphatase 1